MPQAKRSAYLPVVLIVLACASTVVYLAFFRGGSEAASPAAAAAPVEEPARAVRAPEAEPKAEEAAPAPAPAPAPKAPAPAPVPAVAKAEPPAPVPARYEPPATRSASGEIDGFMAEGKWREARAKLSAVFSGPLTDPERADLAKKGMEINRQLLLAEKPDERELELYEIKQGDTLEGIARKFKALNGVKGAVMLVNNYKENSILRAGRKMRVPHGTWSIVVDKSTFKLYTCYEGAPFKEYTVTIGTDQKTPPGKYVVGVRNPKPAWWPPAEMQIKEVPVKYGDPRNPLGEWWISLDHDLYHGIGIHGTNEPQAIGTKASNGCVRMLNEEVGEVAAIAYKGMVVTIVE